MFENVQLVRDRHVDEVGVEENVEGRAKGSVVREEHVRGFVGQVSRLNLQDIGLFFFLLLFLFLGLDLSLSAA